MRVRNGGIGEGTCSERGTKEHSEGRERYQGETGGEKEIEMIGYLSRQIEDHSAG
jgi:hypothetical protein